MIWGYHIICRSNPPAFWYNIFMPELPEVETVKLGLQKYLVGHMIESVEVRLHRILTGDISHLIDARVIGVERFGKGIVIVLDNGYCMAIHIKLTGQLIYQGEDTTGKEISKSKVGTIPNKFTHVIFHLDHDAKLYYNDIRQFGWIKIIKREDLKTLSFFKELGPEPFGELTWDKFDEIVSKSKTKIKPLLMDQTKIGGIGNIYANDSLYLSKISPLRPANSLSLDEKKKLFGAIETVLKKGLENGGASELTYVNALGQEGSYQKHFQVYAQDGKKCRRCGTEIKKIVVAGRGTYYCPICQR